MFADLKFALRAFARTPGFAGLAVLVLALGIGANTAIFSVVNAVLLRALPFQDPGRLVMIWEKNPRLADFLAERCPVALKNLVDWKQSARSFSAMSAYQADNFTLTGSDHPETLEGVSVPADFGDVFGVRPLLGRMFTPEESKAHVVVISHALFLKRFGGDPKTLGRSVELNRSSYTVIGVWPPDFHLPAVWQGFDQKKPAVWLPLDTRSQKEEDLWGRVNFVYARLTPGVTLAQARGEMEAIGTRLQGESPDKNAGFGVNIFPVYEEDVGPNMRRYVLLLQGAVGFVLLIACANVANLLLARSIGRRKELAVRLALGASRFRLIRQMVSESLLLSFGGGALGLLLALLGIKGIMAMAPGDTPHMHELRLDSSALGFTLLMAILTGIVFGLAPSLDAARRNVNEALTQGGRAGIGGGGLKRMRGLLVAGEVALALVLLVGAGLLIRTVQAMLAADPGFRLNGLLTMRMLLPESKYPKEEQTAGFCRELLDKAAGVPGVVSVSLASGLPMQGLSFSSYSVEGAPQVPAVAQTMTTWRGVTEDYFRTMAIPVLRGRTFTRQESEDAKSNSAVVNQMFAKKVWPGGDALGKVVQFRGKSVVIVGVVGDARQLGPDSPINLELYLPSERFRDVTLVARTATAPASFSAALSRVVWSVDKDQPIQQIHTMAESLGEWVSERRFVMLLLGVFAALALVLAAVGIYGVLAYSVSQRTREIGIRIALGASGGGILKLIVGEGLALTAIGAGVGIAGAIALTRLMQGLLYGVSTTDPKVFLAGGLALIGAAALASYIPARRAARLAPLDALRDE
jgi:putative ABC transport system permease protein